MSYFEISEVESVSEIGDASNLISFGALARGRMRKLKGGRDAGNPTIVCGSDPQDPGQLATIAAERSRYAFAFKVELADAPTISDPNDPLLPRPGHVGPVRGLGRERRHQASFGLAIDSAVFNTSAPATNPGLFDWSVGGNFGIL